MKTRKNRWGAFLVVLAGASMVHAAATDPPAIAYRGDGSDLQAVVDAAPTGATITFDAARSLEIATSITLRRSVTLTGLRGCRKNLAGRRS